MSALRRSDIDERHEVLVPCDLSRTGKHRVWVFRRKVEKKRAVIDTADFRYRSVPEPEWHIVRLVSECGPAGDAARRLGAASCAAVVDVVRAELEEGKHDGLPDGINDIVSHGRYVAEARRRERKPEPPDDRPLLVRVLERQARRLSARTLGGDRYRFPIVARLSGRTRLLEIPGRYRGGDYEIARMQPLGRWEVDRDNINKAGKYVGFEHPRCFVCPDEAERTFSDVEIHARSTGHIRNVRETLVSAIFKLPTGGTP